MVIGDVILDEYVWGEVNRISPEAPVPVFEMLGERIGCGGAANVAQNIVSLGGNVVLVSVIGKDSDGEKLLHLLNTLDIRTTDINIDIQRPTSKKTRVIVNPNTVETSLSELDSSDDQILHQGHHLLRIDRESKQDIAAKLKERLLHTTLSQIGECDAIVFADYDKGVVDQELIQKVVLNAKSYNIPIIVDPKRNNFLHYKGATVLTPNHKEAAAALQEEITDVSHLISVGEKILDQLSLPTLLITREEQGMSLFQRDSNGNLQVDHLPPISQEVIDVTGAGDTVVAVFSLAITANADNRSAAELSSLAGGIVVGKMGCSTVTPEELLKAVQKFLGNSDIGNTLKTHVSE